MGGGELDVEGEEKGEHAAGERCSQESTHIHTHTCNKLLLCDIAKRSLQHVVEQCCCCCVVAVVAAAAAAVDRQGDTTSSAWGPQFPV
jgi:hypothetical protein